MIPEKENSEKNYLQKKTKKTEGKFCEICESLATNICIKCLSYYCDSCYKLIHKKKDNNKHKKEKIDNLVPIETKCPEHEKYPKELFCIEEKSKFIFFNFKFRILLCFLSI